ncbi:serine/threonine-protein kinase [Nocardia callitridis]|uniref:non-specific serine/threonine protein kinase n=1 Tax=Nocardia callitridis TaxID=648753 RepID=A0ABP9KKA9_9NOCA
MRHVTISRRFGVGAIDTGQLIAEHYRLVERIGSGGTGVVWRAIDERLQRSVAVKQIHIQPSLPEVDRDVMRQRAIREARNAARFQHPNAIVVFDITEHDGDPCLVMEYLKSKSLAAVIGEEGTLPLTQVARIGEQVASALISAHQAGIVHRDVKPGNILLDEFGTVKITDFGISRATGDATLTETGLICGTAAYLAPEVARGADPTPAADVFALGATLFHALEGEPPYGASANPLAVLYAAANGQVKQPRHAGPATDFLLDLLSPEPEDRPGMRASRDQLAAFADSGPATVAAGFVPASEAFARVRAGEPESATRSLRPSAGGGFVSTDPQPRPAPRRPAPHHNTASHRRQGAQNPRTATHAAPPPPTRTSAQPRREYDEGSGSRNRSVLIGASVGAVIGVIVVVWVIVAAMQGSSNSGTDASGANASASASAQPGGSTSAAVPEAGKTEGVGKADVSESVQQVVDFYNNLTSEGYSAAWQQLTPAAQQVYGSQQDFQSYWSENPVTGWNTATTPSNAADSSGAVRVNVASVTYGDREKSMSFRLIDTGKGAPLIDSDTR